MIYLFLSKKYTFTLLKRPKFISQLQLSPLIPFPPTNQNENSLQKRLILGTSWWYSGCQCRGHTLDPWSRKISHAMGHPGPWATTTEAHVPRACAPQEKPLHEKPLHSDEKQPHLCNQRKPMRSNEDLMQPEINNK